jgi:hypothetical protein
MRGELEPTSTVFADRRNKPQNAHSLQDSNDVLSHLKSSFDEFEKRLTSSRSSVRQKQRRQSSQEWAVQRQPSLSLLHHFATTSSLSCRSPSVEDKNIIISTKTKEKSSNKYFESAWEESCQDDCNDRIKEPDGEPSSISSTINKMHEKAFYDTIQSQFHLDVFLFQIMIHLVPPLLFVLSTNPYVQGIRWNQWKAVRFNILDPFCFYLLIISYFYLSDTEINIVGSSLYIPAMFFVVHRIALGWKYATMSPTEYHRMMCCQENTLIDCYIYQSELLSGWIQLDDLVLTFELGAASARIGNRLNETYFHIAVPNNHDFVASNPFASHSARRHSAFISPIGVSKGDDDPLLQLYVWNEFFRDALDSELTIAHDEEKSSMHSSYIFPPFPLVKEIQRLPTLTTSKISSPAAAGEETDIHFVVSVFDVCKAIIRKANNDNNVVLYVVAIGVYLTMILMILLLVIPVLKQFHQIESLVAMPLFLFSAIMLIWDFGRAYFFFIYVSLVDVCRFLKMIQILHYMIRLTDLVMMKSTTLSPFSAMTHSNHRARISLKTNSPAVGPEKIQINGEATEVMSMAQQHMMAIFDLCESGDLRRSILVKRRPSTSSVNVPAQHADMVSMKTDFHVHTHLKSCSSEDYDSAARVIDTGGMSDVPTSVPSFICPYPDKIRETESKKQRPISDLNSHIVSRWKVIVPRIDLQLLLISGNRVNAGCSSDNVTAWMLTRLAMQHFGERFRFRTDGYLGKIPIFE